MDDQYLLGPDLLVAPMFEGVPERFVYLPPGRWLGFFDGAVHEGPGWETIAPAEIPAILLVRDAPAYRSRGPRSTPRELDLDGVEDWRPTERP